MSLIRETKIKMDGGAVAIFDPEHGTQLGVKTPDSLAVIIGKDGAGHDTLHFFDAKTHKEIPADDLHNYFYKMDIHGGATGGAADHVDAGHVGGSATGELHPTSVVEPKPVGLSKWVESLWHDGMSRAEFVQAYLEANKPPLDIDLATSALHADVGVARGHGHLPDPATGRLMQEANALYSRLVAEHQPAGAASSISHATSLGAGGTSGGGGLVERVVETARVAEPVPVATNVDHALSAGELAAIDFTKHNFDGNDFGIFVSNAKAMLTEIGGRGHHFLSNNNLEFSMRTAGSIYVDMPHTGRPAQVLTPDLYQIIQKHFHDVVQVRGDTSFTKTDWEAIIREHKAAERKS
ncbi:MAG: hypothetical protein ACD_43C00151G0003 [uncultured bacterium]|nr:MAG: hypothetical protein ACD_43C00151G0003 [uncultured bacterium]